MDYNPTGKTREILESAMAHVREAQYRVTARWVFYRLLQDGTLQLKSDYKRLLGYLSKARKGFALDWRPDTLADDTRAPILSQRRGHYQFYERGPSFLSPKSWLETVKRELNCPLDRWATQPNYVEVWFEAAAMQGQFLFHANENVPLLAFHGDVSIPAKWEAALRLARRIETGKTAKVLYFGDLDEKGIQIPESAADDVRRFLWDLGGRDLADKFEFTRVGLNVDHPSRYGIPENPERPGTYQWEGLDDAGAQELISTVEQYLDLDAFQAVQDREDEATEKFRRHLEDLDL